ncbi:hypothetical protein [uncultured Roseobacter sp.]|uniref:hypothetical protein n=1 Tax=uncultured Roseobacter sp. TaxID=114847 RepID=UPI00261E637C|nr:hypothetical protein [uncultured Roseobacter sp.]
MKFLHWTQVFFIAAVCSFLPLFASAEDIDIDALLLKIDEKSGRYDQLIEILQGPNATRALAAFDVMIDTNDKTLRETAISAAIAATDERLRARALWETLVQKDTVTLSIETAELDNEAKTDLDKWIGPVSTWAITARFPETQCLNLNDTARCSPNQSFSVSGLQVDLRYAGRMEGRFSLNEEGVLVGEITNPRSKAVFPASIVLR